MPCELEDLNLRKFKRTQSVNKLPNTAIRVFTEYVLETNNNTPKTINHKNNPDLPIYARDNLSDILHYVDGPKFRSEVRKIP